MTDETPQARNPMLDYLPEPLTFADLTPDEEEQVMALIWNAITHLLREALTLDMDSPGPNATRMTAIARAMQAALLEQYGPFPQILTRLLMDHAVADVIGGAQAR